MIYSLVLSRLDITHEHLISFGEAILKEKTAKALWNLPHGKTVKILHLERS